MHPTTRSILALHVQGVPRIQIARILTVADSTISEAIADNPETVKELQAKYKAKAINADTVDDNMDDLEARALKNLLGKIDSVIDPMQQLAIFKTVNAAKRKSPTTGIMETPPSVSVTLNLPAIMLNSPVVVLNDNNEIVEVNGQTMIAATAKQILAGRDDLLVGDEPLALLQGLDDGRN